jgi:hypothetical protein
MKTLMGLAQANGWLVMYLGANVDAVELQRRRLRIDLVGDASTPESGACSG